MVRQHAISSMLVLLLVLLAAEPGLAQTPASSPSRRPNTRPTVSPYLNLLRRGNPALNYHGIVRPQVEFRSNFQQLQQQLTTVGQAAEEAREADLPTTGHPIRFMNYSQYFLNTGDTSAQRRRPTTTAPGRPSTRVR